MSRPERRAASGGGEEHTEHWPPPSKLGPNLIAHYKAEAQRLRREAINAAFFRVSMRVAKVVRAVLRQAKPRKQNMICRMWHGWTLKPHADHYEAYLKNELFPRLARELTKHGYKGFHILRLDGDDEVEFLTMVWFELAAIRPLLRGRALRRSGHFAEGGGLARALQRALPALRIESNRLSHRRGLNYAVAPPFGRRCRLSGFKNLHQTIFSSVNRFT